MTAALKLTGKQRLLEQEAIIDRGIRQFHEVGQALMKIRTERLYIHDGFTSFEAYLESRQRWRFGRSRAYQLITWAEVSEEVAETSTNGGGAPNERQARELGKLPKESQSAAWEAATEGEADPSAARLKALIDKARATASPAKLHEQPPEKQREAILRAERELREQEARQVNGENTSERIDHIERLCRRLGKLHAGLVDVADEADAALEIYLGIIRRAA